MRWIKNILATLLLLIVWSCRTTEHVPVEVIKSDTTYINHIHRDSIYQRDSVYILNRGDAVLITQTKYLYRDKLVRDTVYASRTDSVQVPCPVERKLTRWEQIRLDMGSWTIWTIIIVILIVIGYMIYKLKK